MHELSHRINSAALLHDLHDWNFTISIAAHIATRISVRIVAAHETLPFVYNNIIELFV